MRASNTVCRPLLGVQYLSQHSTVRHFPITSYGAWLAGDLLDQSRCGDSPASCVHAQSGKSKKGHGKKKGHGAGTDSGVGYGRTGGGVDEDGNLVPASKFPRTAHLFDAGVESGVATSAVTRDDLLWDPKDAQIFFSGLLVALEEKVDGANLGIFITKDYQILCQNRSHFVNHASHWQFATLQRWLDDHREGLYKALKPGRHILYGEWLYAVVRTRSLAWHWSLVACASLTL